MTHTRTHSPHIGIFDSGVGGLSVLRSLCTELPGCRLTYLADNRHLPYGDKSAEWLNARSAQLTAHLLAQCAELILVACNTATTHTIASLRSRWPHVPFVGVEPGVKPAAQSSVKRRIAVLATPATIASARLRELVAVHAGDAEVLLLPCPGLAAAIEDADEAAVARLVDDACATLLKADVDTVVLGCTHYPLVLDRFAHRLGPGVRLVDTAEAIARRVRSLLTPWSPGTCTEICAIASGPAEPVERALQRWIGESIPVHTWPG